MSKSTLKSPEPSTEKVVSHETNGSASTLVVSHPTRPLLTDALGNRQPADGYRIGQAHIDTIHPNPWQPRTQFDGAELAELAESIKENGLLQPPVARIDPEHLGGFQLIAGERRWRAAKLAGLEWINLMIRPATDRQMADLALAENRDRVGVSAIEEARAYRRIMEEFGTSVKELAAQAGKSRPVISNALRLLELPERVQDSIEAGGLSAAHGRALLAFSNFPQFLEFYADAIFSDDIPSRNVEQGIAFDEIRCEQARDAGLLEHVDWSLRKRIPDWQKEYPGTFFRDSHPEAGSDDYYCLDRELYQRLEAEQDAFDEAARQAEDAKREVISAEAVERIKAGDDSVSISQLPRSAYIYAGHGCPPQCTTECPCRVSVKSWYGEDRVTVCLDPERYNALKTEHQAQQQQERKVLAERAGGQIEQLIDGNLKGYPGNFPYHEWDELRIEVLAIMGTLQRLNEKSVAATAKRWGIEVDAKKLTDYNTPLAQKLDVLLSIGNRTDFVAEALLRADLTDLQRDGYNSGQFVKWFLQGTEKLDELENENDA